MTKPSPRPIRSVADAVGRTVGRLTAMIIGFTMTVLGLGMTASIVLLPAGILIGLLGIGVRTRC